MTKGHKPEDREVPEAEKAPAAQTHVADVVIAGQLNRSYTREIHGDGFEELAHSFAKQHPGAEIVVH